MMAPCVPFWTDVFEPLYTPRSFIRLEELLTFGGDRWWLTMVRTDIASRRHIGIGFERKGVPTGGTYHGETS